MTPKKRTPKPDNFSPEPDFPAGHYHFGKPRCQAWSANQGRQCMGLAQVDLGIDKCRVHGGSQRRGISHPNFKTGRHSKYMSANLREKYEERVNDPELLNLGPDIAMIDAMIMSLLEQLNDGAAGNLFPKLLDEIRQFELANAQMARLTEDDPKRIKLRQKANRHLGRLFSTVRRGSESAAIWNEILVAMETKRRLAETERKRLSEMQFLVDVKQMTALMDALLASVRSNVNDRSKLQAIQSDFIRLTGGASQ